MASQRKSQLKLSRSMQPQCKRKLSKCVTAREHIKMMSDKMKQRHDLNVANEGPCLQQGDAVWFHNPQTHSEATTPLARPLHNHEKDQRLGVQNTAKSKVETQSCSLKSSMVVHWCKCSYLVRRIKYSAYYLTYGCDSQVYYTNRFRS